MKSPTFPESIQVIGEFPNLVEEHQAHWDALVLWLPRAMADLKRIDQVHAFEFKVELAIKAIVEHIAREFPTLNNSPLVATMGYDGYKEAENYIKTIQALLRERRDEERGYPMRLEDHPEAFSPQSFWRFLVGKFGGQKLNEVAYEAAAAKIWDSCGNGRWDPSYKTGTKTLHEAWMDSLKQQSSCAVYTIRWMKIEDYAQQNGIWTYKWDSLRSLREVLTAFSVVDQWIQREDPDHHVYDWSFIEGLDKTGVPYKDQGVQVRSIPIAGNSPVSALCPFSDKMGIKMDKDFAKTVQDFVLRYSKRLNNKEE